MKLCAIQPHMPDSISAGVSTITRWMKKAADSGADLVVFPEMMLTGYDFHLHDLFKDTSWPVQVGEALTELSSMVDASGTSALVGLPYRLGEGQLNALVLLEPDREAVLAGARSHLAIGDRNHWGFVEPDDRLPVNFRGILFGSIFCAEALNLDYTQDRGLERSDVILWPGVVGSDYDENKDITRDWNVEYARKIARCYNVPVIQSNYRAYASDISIQTALDSAKMLGGSVACDASGLVLDQASWTEEDMRSFEISKVDGTTVVNPVSENHASEHLSDPHLKTLTNE